MATLTRRHFLHLAAGALAVPLGARLAKADTAPLAHPPPPSTRSLAERLAVYSDGLRYDDLAADTLERLKSHVIDAVGCGIAAFHEGPVRVCREVALAAGTGSSTVLGTSRRTTPDLAAFANSAAIRYYDLNDVYIGKATCHPSDNIAAVLAVAEAERASAAELLTALAVAYEVNCRLADAFDLTTRGWATRRCSAFPPSRSRRAS